MLLVTFSGVKMAGRATDVHSKEETRSPLHLVQPAPNHSWIRHTIVTVLTNQNAMIDSTAVHVTARKVGRAFAAVKRFPT